MAQNWGPQIIATVVPTAEDHSEGITGTLTLSYSVREDKTYIIYAPCNPPPGTPPSLVNRNCLHRWYIEIL